MAQFSICIAGHTAAVTSLFDSTRDYCARYLSDAPADFSVTIRTCESSVKDYLLQAFAILTLEVSYKRIISLPIWETIFFKTF